MWHPRLSVFQDLEQVEEWNEYGEIKENLGSSAPAAFTSTPTPSSTSTPSKPPQASTSAILPSTPTNPPLASPATPSQLSTETTAPEAAKPDPATELASAMRQAGFEAAKKAGDAKTKARTDALEAAKSKNTELQKLDNSGPTGMPPPSGATEATEAMKGESGETTAGSKADAVPPTNLDIEKAESAEKTVEDGAKQENSGKTVTDNGNLPLKLVKERDMVIPSTNEVEHSANEAIANDEEHVLEGKGQAEPEIPTAKEAEQEANKAIVEDESQHIHVAGGAAGVSSKPLEADDTDGAHASKADEEESVPAASKEKSEEGNPKHAPQDTNDEPEPETQKPDQPSNGVSNDTNTEGEGKEPSGSEDQGSNSKTVVEQTPLTAEEAGTDTSRAGIEETSNEAGEQKPTEKASAKGVGATSEGEDLPGTKTQDQPAASGESVGASVAD